MARLFDDASSEYLTNANAVISGTPLTMACWFNTDTLAYYSQMMSVENSGDPTEAFVLQVAFWASSVGAFASSAAATGRAVDSGTITVDTWHHACGVFTSATSRAAFLDGGSKGTNSANVAPSGLDTTNISRWTDAVSYMSGLIAEAAIWNVALTDAEVAILAKGYSPLLVQPQNLVAYWPLIRDEDQDRVGGYDMTDVNTPSIGAHPRVFLPTPPHIAHIAPVSGPSRIPRHPAQYNSLFIY